MAFAVKKQLDGQRRTYKRSNCFIPVDYVVRNRVYRDFIKNISLSGAFISSRAALGVGTEVSMTFSWMKDHDPIKSKGKIVRCATDGFAVVFSAPIPLNEDDDIQTVFLTE